MSEQEGFRLVRVGQVQEVMTPAHPKWDEFLLRLRGPEGCNFRYKGKGKKSTDIIWTCDGTANLPLTRALLAQYPGVDVEESIAYYKAHGGHCDCEVVFNV